MYSKRSCNFNVTYHEMKTQFGPPQNCIIWPRAWVLCKFAILYTLYNIRHRRAGSH